MEKPGIKLNGSLPMILVFLIQLILFAAAYGRLSGSMDSVLYRLDRIERIVLEAPRERL